MSDIQSSPYASWLEDILRAIVELKPDKIGLVMQNNDGDYCTAYWGDCSPWDKANLAFHMQADAFKGLMIVNLDTIMEAAEEMKATAEELLEAEVEPEDEQEEE